MDPIDTYLEIRRCAAEAEAGMSRAAKHVGLTPAQAAALVLLARHGPRPISRFSRALSINLSSLTQVADGLERAGYAKRQYSLTDRRVHELVITDQGREAAAVFLAALQRATGQPTDAGDDRPQVLD